MLTHLSQFFFLVHHRDTFRLILPALGLALVLVALFLLARLLFLAFVKSRSASWHSHPLIIIFYYDGRLLALFAAWAQFLSLANCSRGLLHPLITSSLDIILP